MTGEVVRRGLVDREDAALYRITDDVAVAVEEILGFYRNYHSRRFVGSTMVMRCRFAPTDEELAALNEEFADICSPKGIWRTEPLAARARRPRPPRAQAARPRVRPPFARPAPHAHRRHQPLAGAELTELRASPSELVLLAFEDAAGAARAACDHERRGPLDGVAGPGQQLLPHEVRVGLRRLAAAPQLGAQRVVGRVAEPLGRARRARPGCPPGSRRPSAALLLARRSVSGLGGEAKAPGERS